MPINAEKGDIRSVKTEKALNGAMLALLLKHNFRKITVRDICEESVISRATFYSRFTDKYNFLKWWILTVWPDDIFKREDVYGVKEEKLNKFLREHKTIIKNIIYDADSWTLDVLFDILHSILHLTIEKTINGSVNPQYVVLSNFYIGGMIQYFLWQVKNNFPPDINPMNDNLYEVIKIFRGWN